jgi:choline dehydrogenase-like flavoprotein
MHIDARELDNNSIIEGDLCIIGAGAAGISMAMDWNNSGKKVILLEGGGFSYDPEVQDLYAGKTTGQKYFPLKSVRLHYFGGTTGHWSGFCSTFDPIDFEKREWIAHSGWPISWKDLDPFYPRAHKYLELGPYEYDLKYWQAKDKELIPLVDNEVVWNKIWQFSSPSRFGTLYREPIVKSRNIHLYTFANVVDIHLRENLGTVEYVTVKNMAGKTHRVKAKQFVLAASAIQNARLLLASNKQIPAGIGNEHDLVGRYFMEHLEIKSAELWLAKADRLKLYEYVSRQTPARAELAITRESQIKHQILNGTASLTPLEIARKRKPIIEMWKEEDPRVSLDSLRAGFSKRMGEGVKVENFAYELFTRIEQAPNPNSRVTLDTETDALGVPRNKLHWELSPLDKKSIRKIYELLGKEVGKTGKGRVRLIEYLHDENDDSWPDFTGGGWHHMGTTRMSDNPQNGVVDANCKVHAIENLHVAGSSCFTTAGAANPTLTLVALTLRLSDHLKSKG